MIPIDEQPYPLPVGWQWCRLGDVCEFINGYAFKSEKFSSIGVPVIRISDIKNGVVDLSKCVFTTENVHESFIVHNGDLLIALSGATTGKNGIYFSNEKAFLNQRIVNIKIKKDAHLISGYRNFYLSFIGNDILQISYGGAQPNISSNKLKKIFIPLPPLDEQQRIVALLDELFANLDEAKALAQAIVDGSKLRRAAILHKAFIGELTKLWRDEHGITLDDWQRCLLGDVCQINPPKISTRDLSDDLEVSFVPMAAVSDVRGEITAPQKKFLREVKRGFTNFSEGDVLFAKITPCMENGKVALVGELVNHIGYGSTEFFVLRCGEKILNRFVYHRVRWQIFRNDAKSVMAGAVGQQRVPKRFLTGYQLNLPPLEEQKEIVRLLDDLLGREQQTKNLAGKTLEHIEILRKSILSRVFRGELVLGEQF